MERDGLTILFERNFYKELVRIMMQRAIADIHVGDCPDAPSSMPLVIEGRLRNYIYDNYDRNSPEVSSLYNCVIVTQYNMGTKVASLVFKNYDLDDVSMKPRFTVARKIGQRLGVTDGWFNNG